MKDGKLIPVLVQGPRRSLENRYQYLYKGWDEEWKTDTSIGTRAETKFEKPIPVSVQGLG